MLTTQENNSNPGTRIVPSWDDSLIPATNPVADWSIFVYYVTWFLPTTAKRSVSTPLKSAGTGSEDAWGTTAEKHLVCRFISLDHSPQKLVSITLGRKSGAPFHLNFCALIRHTHTHVSHLVGAFSHKSTRTLQIFNYSYMQAYLYL